MGDSNGQWQAWMRTAVLVASMIASITVAAVHVEARLTALEVGQKDLAERVLRMEERLEHLADRR
jgi:hypothetical protein